MGITGAAIATALTDLIAFLILFNHYRKIRETTLISLVPPRGRIVWENLRDIVLSGLPSGWLTFLGASGSVVQSNCYAIVGTEAVAGWGIVNRIIFIVIYTTHGIAQGVLPLVGYNYGAKNVARARACIAYAAKLLMAVAFAVMILCELFGPQIMRAFLDTDEVVTAGTTIVRVHMLCAPLMATVLFVSTLCQAVGRWQYSLVFLTVRQLCVNIPLTILMTHTIGLAGTAGAQPVCDFICCVAALLIYRHVFVTSISREEAGADAAS
jgi:Na+-driven multidrug efflux pump